jgi:predicted dehydrogenase
MLGRTEVERVRAGVIGAGIMGKAHAAVLADYPRSEVVAVASEHGDSARVFAESHPGVKVYADYRQMLADPDIDLVTIATPDHAHADIAVAAAQAGKHLIIEKPLTTSLTDADRVIAAVRDARVTAMTLFNHRWVPAYAQATDRIDEGEIGRAVVGYARKNDWIYVPTEMLKWADQTSPAWFLSSHDIDLMCWFFNDQAVEVYATAVERVLERRGIHTPDAIQAQVRFSRGAVATFEACWIYPNTFPTMTDSFMEVIGESGVIHLDRKREQIEIATNKRFEYPRNLLMMNLHGRQAGAVRNAICHVVDCIVEQRAPLVSLESSRHVTAILEAIHRSVVSGSPTPVEGVADA